MISPTLSFDKLFLIKILDATAPKPARVTAFFYLFSVALGIGLGVFTGRAWILEHRNGVWSVRAIAIVAIASIALGLLVGWGLDTYAAYVRTTMQR